MHETTSTLEDYELERRTIRVLHIRGICDAKQVVVKVASGTVIVCGELASREAKWRCLECCRHVAGVIRVVDQLRVS
jgi:osmotically-inducible protein OsmY